MKKYYEMWLSLVERCVRDAEVASSNLVISTSGSVCTYVSGVVAAEFFYFRFILFAVVDYEYSYN